MFELSSETTVADLQANSPAMTEALVATGMFREGDDPGVTIGELCWDYGLNPLVVLRALVRARATQEPSPIDVSELDGLTLTQIVENIESTHHAYLRRVLPVLDQLIDRVAQVFGQRDSRLLEIQVVFRKMSADLQNHMLHEEEALFPMVRDMESTGAVKPTRCGDAVGGPIACMENEHEAAKFELGRLRTLTDDFAVPGDATHTYREMLARLAEFRQDMLVHIHKEDKVLFPGALNAQTELREHG